MDFITIEQCAPTVAPSTMQRIIKVESGFMPYAIGYHITKEGKTYRLTAQPRNQAEATHWARWFLQQGYRFDAGLAQINSNNFTRLGLNANNMFDACTNIRAGGKIFTEFYQRAVRQYGSNQQAVKAAISAYQTGSFTRGYLTGYVQRVSGITSRFSNKIEVNKVGNTSLFTMLPQAAPTQVAFN